jgi:transcriptional regulator with XRE-family HTH domain
MRMLNDLPRILEERGLSQADLARLAGLAYPVVQRAVRPNANPFVDDVLTIARVLGVPAQRLFYLSSSSPK